MRLEKKLWRNGERRRTPCGFRCWVNGPHYIATRSCFALNNRSQTTIESQRAATVRCADYCRSFLYRPGRMVMLSDKEGVCTHAERIDNIYDPHRAKWFIYGLAHCHRLRMIVAQVYNRVHKNKWNIGHLQPVPSHTLHTHDGDSVRLVSGCCGVRRCYGLFWRLAFHGATLPHWTIIWLHNSIFEWMKCVTMRPAAAFGERVFCYHLLLITLRACACV